MHSKRRVAACAVAVGCLLLCWAFAAKFLAVRERTHTPRAAPPVAVQRARAARGALGPERVDGALTGRVRQASGEPIPAARVCAIDAIELSAAERIVCAETDGQGRYRLACKLPGSFRVSASARGFAPGKANGGKPIALRDPGAAAEFDVVLSEKGARLSGTVVDASGGAIAGARVRAADEHTAMEAETNDAGEFEVWVEPGNVSLRAQVAGYATAFTGVIAPAADVVLKLTPGSTLAGVVRSRSTGEPIPDARVHAVKYGSWAHPEAPWGISDSDGAFTIRDVEQGLYRLVARGADCQGQAEGPFELSVADARQDLTIWVSRGLGVSGRVVADDGQACEDGFVALAETAGAQLGLASLLSPISAGGGVHFEGVAPGNYRAQVECVGHMLREGPETIAVGSEPLDRLVWRVARGLSLTVKVVDTARRPVPGMSVLMQYPPGPDGSRQSVVLTADAKGECQVPSVLAPGAYAFETGIGVRASANIELGPKDAERDVVLTVPASGAILVTVVNGAGRPVDQVMVAAEAVAQPGRSPERAEPRSIFSTAPMLSAPSPALLSASRRIAAGSMGHALGDGRFRIGPLEPGTYEVTVDDLVNASTRASGPRGSVVELRHHEVSLRVVLERNGQIRGRVLDAEGGPASDVWVSAAHESHEVAFNQTGAGPSQGQRALTDGDGEFELTGLDPRQRFNVSAERPYGSVAVLRGVTPGADLTLRLPRLGELSGNVLDAFAGERRPATVQVVHEDTGYKRGVLVDQSGSWSIDRVLPGTLRIFAFADDGRHTEQLLELTPSERRGSVRLTLPAEPPDLARDGPAASERLEARTPARGEERSK